MSKNAIFGRQRPRALLTAREHRRVRCGNGERVRVFHTEDAKGSKKRAKIFDAKRTKGSKKHTGRRPPWGGVHRKRFGPEGSRNMQKSNPLPKLRQWLRENAQKTRTLCMRCTEGFEFCRRGRDGDDKGFEKPAQKTRKISNPLNLRGRSRSTWRNARTWCFSFREGREKNPI